MKKRDIFYLLAFMFIINLAVSGIFGLPAAKQPTVQVQEQTDTVPAPPLNPPGYGEPELSPEFIKINARSACVIDFDTGTIIYEKNAFRKRPMASTTKIMTAILALENCSLDDMVTISGKAAYMGGSVMGLREGSTVRLKDLLYGMLVCSGNDAAVAIAEHCGGTTAEFAEMMNQKAAEIGAYETSFSNPHGLDAENHYTTAYDLAKITRYALKNPVFNRIVNTKEYQFEGRTLYNTNDMLSTYEGANGVKTGYTGLAGRCLVTSATRNNIRLISVVLFCDTPYLRRLSSSSILDYGFQEFGYVNLLEQGSIMGEVNVNRARGIDKIRAGVADSVKVIMKNGKRDMLYTRVSLPGIMEAPVKRGTILGTVSVFQGESIIAESSLIAMDGAEKKELKDYLDQVIDRWTRIIQ